MTSLRLHTKPHSPTSLPYTNGNASRHIPTAYPSRPPRSPDHNTARTAPGPSLGLLSYMTDRLCTTLDPTPLDRTLASQAQTSGRLNAKQRELRQLQDTAQRRLAAARLNFRDGLSAAREVERELEWAQQRAKAVNARAAQKYPLEYMAATRKYSGAYEY